MDDSDDDYGFGFFRHRQPPPSPLTLISFYDGSGRDGRGRSLEDILQWDARRLESSHDYIQTLFPLPEKSGVNDRAPIINKDVFEAFRSRVELRDKLREAFKKMLWFYGFELHEDAKLEVRPGPNFKNHSELWNSRFDHNHLRITRIIRCLRVLGLQDEALAFYDTISCASSVSSRSRAYWRRAAHRQLNFSPDLSESDADPEDARIGPKFLFEFEQQEKEIAKIMVESKEENDIQQAIHISQGEEGKMAVKTEASSGGATGHAEADIVEDNRKKPLDPTDIDVNATSATESSSKVVELEGQAGSTTNCSAINGEDSNAAGITENLEGNEPRSVHDPQAQVSLGQVNELQETKNDGP